MPYMISGTVNEPARIFTMSEAGWVIEDITVVAAGNYSVMGLSAGGTKLVMARSEVDGDVLGYGAVDAVAY